MRVSTSMPSGRRSLVVAALLCACAGAVRAQPQAHVRYEPPRPGGLEGAANLLLRAAVTASPHWSTCVPTLAVDGHHDSAGRHWAAENIPVWLTVDLTAPRELNALRLWTYWDNRRVYQYVIEGSVDGKAWTVLADRRDNTTPATEAGETFCFPTLAVRHVRTTFTHNSVGNTTGGHIVEIEGYCLAPRVAAELAARTASWGREPGGLRAAWGSPDVRYARDEVPDARDVPEQSWVGWRGERVHAQAVLWSRVGARQVRLVPAPLRAETGQELPAACVRSAFVRYVSADGKLVPDVLDTAPRLDMAPQSARPAWVSVDVPRDAGPGTYRGQIEVRAQGGAVAQLPLRVEVLPLVMPPATEWSFWLDLWQNPFALARYHRVAPWSPEHLQLLEPHLRLLASAGQKCITTTLVHQPWGTQTYDPYESMIEWIRRPDGTFRYDYTHFDQYVELGMRCGIRGAINCYSMLPWSSSFRYLDEATGSDEVLHAGVGTPAYEAHWRSFLTDFTQHLTARGWLGCAAIAMDELPPKAMRPMLAFLRAAAPALKVALAGGNTPELKDDVDDWCVFITPPLDPAVARERIARGKPTTFYVCCGPGKPNTFTASPPAEAAWLGLYAAAQGYSGFLRWAFDSWVEDPLMDTSYVTWTAGDCFLVYPGARSSIRFERLREGIQDYETIRLLRGLRAKREGAGEGLRRLDEALARFTYARVQQEPAAEAVNHVHGVLVDLSRVATGT